MEYQFKVQLKSISKPPVWRKIGINYVSNNFPKNKRHMLVMKHISATLVLKDQDTLSSSSTSIR